VVDTGVRHRLTDGGYNQRRVECDEALALLRAKGFALRSLSACPPIHLSAALAALPPHLTRRVAHVVSETSRVGAAAAALATGDLRTLGRLMLESHASLRDDFEASCEEADVLVAAAMQLGALGARLTGAGWGGNVIVLADDRVAARVIIEVQHQFARIYGRIPEAWVTRASSGVKRESPGG
jgi:galactokinase